MKSKNRPTKKISSIRWEYRIDFVKEGAMDPRTLVDLGRDGWELCGTVASAQPPSDLSSNWPAVVKFYFKRQIR